MNRNQNKTHTTFSNSLNIIDRTVRTIVGFGGILAILTGVATAPIQYFILSSLGIYLVHTAIIGVDPFYVAARRLWVIFAHDHSNRSISSAGAH